MKTIKTNSYQFLREMLMIPVFMSFGFIVSAQNFNPIPNPSDSTSMSTQICGDLHELREQMQNEYQNYRSGGNNMKSAGQWDPAAVFQCGSFTIYYKDIDDPEFQGTGFDDPVEGAARRNTLCEVLAYLESVIEVHPNANPSIFVDGSYSNINPAPDNENFLAQAISYYSQEVGNFYGIDPGIYNGHFFNHINTGVDPDPLYDYDAYLQVNYDPFINEVDPFDLNIYFTSDIDFSDPVNNVNKFDLYSLLLHEVTHMMGVSSSMKEDENYEIVSSNNGNSFTKYDWLFGHYGDITDPSSFANNKLVVGTTSSPQINQTVNNADDYPLRRSKIWLYDNGAPSNHNMFAGIGQSNPLSALNNTWRGSFLSHLGNGINNFFNQQFSPGKYVTYVMQPGFVWQEVNREWSLAELRLLQQLGYSFNANFTAATNLSPPNLNQEVIENSPPYRDDYGDINHRLTVLPIDGFPGDFVENAPSDESMDNSNTVDNPTVSQLVINIADDPTFIDDDGDPISVRAESVFGIRGVSIDGNNHDRLILDASGTVFTFTPEPGFHGRAEFGFYLWDGKEVGAMEVYTIDVEKDENLEYDEDQELIINGDFEDGMEIRTWETLDKIYTPHEIVNLEPILHWGTIGAGGGHPFSFGSFNSRVNHSFDNFPNYANYGVDNGFGIYGSWNVSWPWNFGTLTPHANITTQQNLRYAAPVNLVNTLVAPLLPGEDYMVRFDLGCSNPSLTIGQSLSNMEINVIEEPANLNFISIQEIEHNLEVEALIQDMNPTQWQSVEIPFKYCGDSPADYVLFDTDGSFCYVDNISLKVNTNLPEFSVNAGQDIYLSADCDSQELEAILFNAGCDLTFSWTPIAGLDDPTILNPIASPSQTTTYTILVTDNLTGATATDEVTVYVDEDIVEYGDIDLCLDSDPFDLSSNVSPAGGTFFVVQSSQLVELENGYFDPVEYGSGSYSVIYQIGEDPCLQQVVFVVNVGGVVDPTHPNGLIVADGSASDGAVLTGSLQFLDDLIIEDDAVFTFSNAQVQFAEGKGIHIMPGGKIFIENNSHITNLDCENHWLGIHVNGVHNITEYGSFADFHGQCTITNSTIENALTGVANFGNPYDSDFRGGLITCESATFKNCEVSVDLQAHQNYHPTLNYTYPIKCKFYNSTFLWDDDFQFISSIDNPMMRMQNVYRVTISGCEFKNDNTQIFDYPNNSPHKSAIYARKASINMTKGCNGSPPYLFDPSGNCASGNVPSTVEGFNYGIVLHTGSESIISETGFKCYRGLWSTGSKSLKVTQNTFSDLPPAMLGMGSGTNPFNPMWPIPYGVYLNYSTLFWFEDNTFNYPNTTQEAGLFIRSSGAPYHQIYDNNFWSTYFGVVAYDDNRGLNGNSGLKIECNNFTNDERAIITYPTTGNIPPGWGISHFQGMPQTPDAPPFPAGNYYTNTGQIDVYNLLEWVNYYTHPAENVTNTVGVTEIDLNEENACPSSFSSGLFEKELMASGHKASADSIADELALIVDDGDTDGLTEEVVLAQYGEAVELYYDLMQVSPNLSEEVMIEAINKEIELPAALLTLILNSNPHAAKSGKVQKELDERMQPLEEYQRTMIDEGLDLVSYKEELEARQSHHEGRYNGFLNQIIIETLADTSIGDKITAIEGKITGYENVDHYYLLIDLYLQNNDVSGAQAQLNAIATDFNLDPRRDAEYADFIDVYGIIFGKVSSGDTSLTSMEFNTLETIAYRHSTLAAGLALTTLNYYADYDFLEVLVEPDFQGKSNKINRNKVKQPKIKRCSVYPNPTSGILMVEIPGEFKSVKATLTDMQGKVVYEERNLEGIATLNLRKESSASYQLQLLTEDGKLNETHRIQITK